jgi:ubiquinone/menaquinone biosynthesis C-methylase UbiE
MSFFKAALKSIPAVNRAVRALDNQHERNEFVHAALAAIPAGKTLLDAGCGSQRYRPACAHLLYKSQDFGQYDVDLKKMIGSDDPSGEQKYAYGTLDYVGNIWEIAAPDASFDAILCTEVFEHIPYPNETLREFSRLLKPGGQLILTAPSNCLRHMDPYFFYAGFSDRWFERFLAESGLTAQEITPVGDYYSWLSVEVARTALTHSILAKLALLPAFLYFRSQKKTSLSTDTLCMGYHVIAYKPLV